MSAKTKTVLVGLAVMLAAAAVESVKKYLEVDTTPTWGEAAQAVGSGVLGAFLYWLKGPQAGSGTGTQ